MIKSKCFSFLCLFRFLFAMNIFVGSNMLSWMRWNCVNACVCACVCEFNFSRYSSAEFSYKTINVNIYDTCLGSYCVLQLAFAFFLPFYPCLMLGTQHTQYFRFTGIYRFMHIHTQLSTKLYRIYTYTTLVVVVGWLLRCCLVLLDCYCY